ncbi:MAG: hypothetical protein ACI8WB_002986 [Phenylobacterium sp.]|jgi:hypothetical protein
MRITASQIAEWVNTHAKTAQTDLPRLIRRLCFDSQATRQLIFPAGDSTFVPGWDGVLTSEQGNTWVPNGTSYWEIGCSGVIATKANGDYNKRLTQTDAQVRANTTYVFVTPHRWTKKSDWLTDKLDKNEWADIRVYDADDLEQWLEQSPAISLQFSEELGLCGHGVESLARHWQAWSQQSQPAITDDAFFIDRIATRDRLLNKVNEALCAPRSGMTIVVRADSVEEATAFTVATLMTELKLANQSLVVTTTEGWRFVDANSELKIAIAAQTKVAAAPSQRQGLLVIIPHVLGEINVTSNKSSADEIILERPAIYEFEKTLTEIGVEKSDAKRYAFSTGRSWTVFRRQSATNPAIRKPVWLEQSQSDSLVILCLLGTWSADNETDCQIVARLADKPYETIQEDLQQLATMDDSPILSIGSVWKAKSPLELLSLFSHRITRTQLDRFFLIAKEMLTVPDPQLELPEEQRYAAQIHNKVHPFSGRLFQSVCDALIKLAVRGAEQQSLQALGVEQRVHHFVHELLDNANSERWLSLASYLSSLAEAAPDAFLNAVEKSLKLPDAPVSRLLTETSDSGSGGRCWHADLLWALEVLAWSPRTFPKVALILAQLTHIQIKGNSGNTPGNSLYGLFRSWWPQTAANVDERIKVLDLLIRKDSDAAYQVLTRLTSRGQKMASPANQPKWRDDDAGSDSVTNHEVYIMVNAAQERIYQLSKGNATRLVQLLQQTPTEEYEEFSQVLERLKPFTQPEAQDEDRLALQTALRDKIHSHLNYHDAPGANAAKLLVEMNLYYEQLSPADFILRHIWLFSDNWMDLPYKDPDNHDNSAKLKQLRTTALDDIYQSLGIHSIEVLIMDCHQPDAVGNILIDMQWSEISWDLWIVDKGEEFISGDHMSQCIFGMLWAMSTPDINELITNVMALGKQRAWDNDKFARFLTLAPSRKVRQIAKDSGPEINQAYWTIVNPSHFRGDDEDESTFVLDQLMQVDRPLVALHYCQFAPDKVDAKVLLVVMKQALHSKEENIPWPRSYHLIKMIEHLEVSAEIDRGTLLQLEFTYLPALGHNNEAKATTLYEAVTTSPDFFTELICLLYKPEHGERTKAIDGGLKTAANNAWNLLHGYSRLPGTQKDGTIEHDSFKQFIEDTRERCRKADRLTTCDQTLGQILASSPTGDDGAWPCSIVCDLLDMDEMHHIRKGFYSGVINSRGVTTRSMVEGGAQERSLAAYYRSHAEKHQFSYLNVAQLLEEIAKSYEWEAQREDEQANLNKERY